VPGANATGRNRIIEVALRLAFPGSIQSLAQFRHDTPQIEEAFQILGAQGKDAGTLVLEVRFALIFNRITEVRERDGVLKGISRLTGRFVRRVYFENVRAKVDHGIDRRNCEFPILISNLEVYATDLQVLG
jgi:hypothetical protein